MGSQEAIRKQAAQWIKKANEQNVAEMRDQNTPREEAPVLQNQEEPERQPIQPEVGGEAGKEREPEEEALLDTFEQTLLDILEED